MEEALSTYNENTYANRLLIAIDEKDLEELNVAIAEAELVFLGGEISRFLNSCIEKCEFNGLKSSSKSKIIETGLLRKHYLDEIRETLKLKEVIAGKSKERAEYLITEARLMQEIEPNKETELRTVLAKYCNAKASQAISEMYEGSLDVARYFYSESFVLEDDWDFLRTQVALYLNSLKSTNKELIKDSSPSFETTLKVLFGDGDDFDFHIWNNILSIFIYNKTITAQIIKRIFDIEKYKQLSFKFLSKIGITVNNKQTLNEYAEAWNQARELRKKEYRQWFSSISAICNNENLESLSNILLEVFKNIKKPWLSQLDIERIDIIINEIYRDLFIYLKQSGYRDKERSYNFLKVQVNQLQSEIKDRPTKHSFEGILPLLEKIGLLLDKSFKTIESASEPIIKISILGEASIISTDKTVPIKLLVENAKNSSPIRDISIEVIKNENIISCNKGEYFDSIEGGEKAEIHLKAIVSENVINDKATSIDIVFNYKKRNQEEGTSIKEQLTLRLYSEEEFEPIPNPYETFANSGPVFDTKMFYGRNEFIERITEAIIKADSKQVVIYGQKRSGKSSVLHHLQKSLEASDKTFCINFNIGDIFETLTSTTFFYKILSLIEEELENLQSDGIEVPSFNVLPYSDFKEQPNPADLFRKEIKKFKKECSLLESWKERKLVVMIDEFTYLYTAIKEQKVSDAIMKQWKAITQNEDSTFSSVLVGQDVFPMFKDEFPNEFGVTQDERLTYLSKDDAIRLIEEPIGKTKTNRNRFIADAIDTIIDYTSCNPYYIQIFCARLVNEMNRKKYIEVTSADIKEIADSFIYGGQALTDDKFDNLLNAGEKHDIQKIPQEHSKAILRKIATNAMNIGFCLREQISIGQPEYEDEILHDLVKREVLEQKNDSYKIQVKLFQEWLLKH